MASEISLGNDQPTTEKILRILFLITSSAVLLFFLANVPQEFSRSNFYLALTLLSLIVIAFDLILKNEIIDTVTESPEESPMYSFVQRLGLGYYTVMFLIGIALAAWVFFQISATKVAIVGAPTFQTIPQEFLENPYLRAFLSGFVGILENQIFFGFLFPTIYSILYRRFGIGLFGIPIAGLLAIGIFTIFHFSVYGFSQAPQMQSVFIFGIINIGLVYFFRSLVPSDIYHFGNNFIITLFQYVRF